MSPAPSARFSFVAAVTGIVVFAVALFGTGGGCSLNTAGITDPGNGPFGTGGHGSDSRGGLGGNTSIVTGSGGSTVDASTGSGGSADGTGGSTSGDGGMTGSGGAPITGSGGARDGAGGEPVTGAGGAIITGSGGVPSGTGGTNNGSGGTSAGGAPGTGGRATGGAPGMGGAGMGGAPGTGGAPVVSVIGCADGTREAFVNVNNFPSIAGCAGAWSVAGVISAASMNPACNRAAGNTGTRPMGNGCSVADLCAVGWHVCGGANELDSLNVTCAQAGIPNATNNPNSRVLYATRQRGVSGSTCNANDMVGTNDVHGCGNFGLAEDPNCAPLNFQFSHTECDEVPTWSCTGVLATTEGLIVTKDDSTNGGVLCCK